MHVLAAAPSSRPWRAPGHPRRRPDAPLGDKGYDSNPNREELRKRRILPVVSRKGAPAVKALDIPCRPRMSEHGSTHHINPS